jgi:hypothetical protein
MNNRELAELLMQNPDQQVFLLDHEWGPCAATRAYVARCIQQFFTHVGGTIENVESYDIMTEQSAAEHQAKVDAWPTRDMKAEYDLVNTPEFPWRDGYEAFYKMNENAVANSKELLRRYHNEYTLVTVIDDFAT